MVSFLDIPSRYVVPHQKTLFLAWVRRLPAEARVKRELMHAWFAKTNLPATKQDYEDAGL